MPSPSSLTSAPHRLIRAIRRAFNQFLALPLATVAGFVGLNAGVYLADRVWSEGRVPDGLAWLGKLCGDHQAIGSLLTTLASSIITVTSITFSLLLIAVQQGSAALTAQVTDQFMMRRANQLYFGYFVGLSVFVLLTLLTNSAFHRPVFGTMLALIMTTAALCLIILMIYNTIDQMRPEQIVLFIHRRILRAREHDEPVLSQTRRAPRRHWVLASTIRSPESGHVVGVERTQLRTAVESRGRGGVELELLVPLGSQLAVGDPLFALRVDPHQVLDPKHREEIAHAAVAAVTFDAGRDLKQDARYGLHQLATIAWTSTSTAKSNPNPGQSVVHALRDIIALWSPREADPQEDPSSPLVYADRTPSEATDALELIILVASESMQAQTLADALRTVAILLGHVSQPTAERLADVARRAVSSLGEHVLTRQLAAALDELTDALDRRGFATIAGAVADAATQLGASLGKLNSRSTRVPAVAGP
ncbi:DUF2254 family protein [Methylobacterium durans]|uniref:DUF2254 domain-containing protein n=1 Tax=Methylobacterium durans TaxID=2202825 RepID=A0A2U8W8S5_9HYPH|nr:DUF2254 family protein [Methylobacterium durans]AWN42534.1 hypothetical protein DK389_21045 [Methylobacterium durans]